MNELDRETQFEQRLARLEAEVARLKAAMPAGHGPLAPGPGVVDGRPWWEAIAGKYANDPGFEEAMRLGREWRESFRPKATPRPKSKAGPKAKSPKPVKSAPVPPGKRTHARAGHGSR